MIEENLLENFTPTDRQLLARQVLMQGFIHPQDACPDAALRLAMTMMGLYQNIYTADSIAAACREDNRKGLGENWRLDKIKSFDYIDPAFFIEFASPGKPQETGGCLFSSDAICVTPALSDLAEKERDFIIENVANLIENIKIDPSDNSPETRWQKAFTYYLVRGKFRPDFPGNEPIPNCMNLPAFEAFLKLAPENFVFHFTATAFYYCANCRDNEISSAKWHFFLDAEKRLVSPIIPETVTEMLELPEFMEMERYNRANILTPCLFALTQLNDKFRKTENDNLAYLEIPGEEIITRLRSLGVEA